MRTLARETPTRTTSLARDSGAYTRISPSSPGGRSPHSTIAPYSAQWRGTVACRALAERGSCVSLSTACPGAEALATRLG
eukprot:scaffold102798_cov80-Phaeocystis_antarctica.AAC.2